jgi:hypothetical protein
LAEVTAVTQLCLARFRVPAWRNVAVGLVSFSLGALPFIITFISGKENVADPHLFAEIRAGERVPCSPAGESAMIWPASSARSVAKIHAVT